MVSYGVRGARAQLIEHRVTSQELTPTSAPINGEMVEQDPHLWSHRLRQALKQAFSRQFDDGYRLLARHAGKTL